MAQEYRIDTKLFGSGRPFFCAMCVLNVSRARHRDCCTRSHEPWSDDAVTVGCSWHKECLCVSIMSAWKPKIGSSQLQGGNQHSLSIQALVLSPLQWRVTVCARSDDFLKAKKQNGCHVGRHMLTQQVRHYFVTHTRLKPLQPSKIFGQRSALLTMSSHLGAGQSQFSFPFVPLCVCSKRSSHRTGNKHIPRSDLIPGCVVIQWSAIYSPRRLKCNRRILTYLLDLDLVLWPKQIPAILIKITKSHIFGFRN